jgi:peptidoglycan/LPS O-acetylase OafA/YrhL
MVTLWTAIFERHALGQLRGDVLAGTFYVSNWYQIWEGLGYTASGDFAPLRHLWSLAVEEQFYLIWPIIMVLLLGRAGTRRVADVSRWLFVAAVAITVLVALAFHAGPIGEPSQTPEAYWWIGGRPISKLDTLYLGTFTRAGGLLLGAAFALVWRPYAVMRGPLRTKGHLFDVFAFLALVFLAWMCWATPLVTVDGADPQLFRGGLFFAGLAMLVLIAAVSHRGAFAGRLLGMPVLVWIGVRSYGLYLFHWPIFMIIRGVAGNPLSVREFAIAMAATVAITELSFRYVETPIRRGEMSAGWRRFRRGATAIPRPALVGATAVLVVLSAFAVAALATAPLQQNEIAVALDENEEFTTNLLDVPPAAVPGGTRGGEVDAPATTRSPVDDATATDPTTSTTPTTDTAVDTATTVAGGAAVVEPGTVGSTAPVVAAPSTTVTDTTIALATPAPVQAGVVNDMSAMTPLAVAEPTNGGYKLVALGDSVMLGAAEELGALGFLVDAVVSRQMKNYLPDMQAIRDMGVFGSAVVVHLGTNGPFSQETLDETMAVLADVPIVLMVTSKAERGWVAGNNDKVRALPAAYPNVTVLDWEVLAGACPGDCFYDDGIHLNQFGQTYYTGLVGATLGLT